MGIIIRPVLGSINPASIEDETERLKRESEAQVRLDYPTATFRDGAPVEEPAVEPVAPPSPRAPQLITVGNPNAKNQLSEEQLATPPKEGGFVKAVKAVGPGLRAGKKMLRQAWEGVLLRDIESQSDEGVDLSKMDVRDLASIPLSAQQAMAKSKTPKAEREKIAKRHLETIAVIDDEIAGLRPKSKDFWTNAAFDAASSVAFMGPALAIGIVGRTPSALTAIGGSTYYKSYADHRAGGASPERAARFAGVDGIVEATTEAFPTSKLLSSKGFIRKLIGSLLADIPGEQVANVVQTATANLARLPEDADNATIKRTLRNSFVQAVEQAPAVAATTVLAGGALAGAAAGVEAAADKLTAPLEGGQPLPVTPAPISRPPPGLTTPLPGPAPAAPTAAGTAAAPRPGLPKPGDALLFKPVANAPGAVVVIQKVSPASRTAIVSRVDPETGDPFLNEDGEPESFVASFEDLKISDVPPAAAAQAAKPSAAAPPAATSVEPVSDIVAQVKDMQRSDTPRRGVYVSPATVASMKANGTYLDLLKQGQVEENFDGQGGTLIVKSKKDLDEARAARDSGQVDMQTIIGALTGAGIAKPKTPKPAVVQRKDETGAVVQQTAVEPAAVPAAVAAVKDLPGIVEVTTPEAVIEEREAKVADEAAPQATTPPARPKPGDTFGAADFAIQFADTQLNTPKEGNLQKTDVRASAQAVGVAAQMLRAAANDALARGAPPELVQVITSKDPRKLGIATRWERIGDKPEADFVKGRGVSEPKLRAALDAIQGAMKTLEPYRNAPKVEAPKVEVAKKASKRTKPAKEVVAREGTEEKVTGQEGKTAEATAPVLTEQKPSGGAAELQVRPAPKEVGPTGVQVAPPGERTVQRKKKKYIPPKKQLTTEEIAAKVAEDTAPPKVETIELAPVVVAGAEEAFITELMGATPRELQQELKLDPTGRMSAVLLDLVKAMGDRNSWTGWFSAVTRGGVMDRTQRNEMLGLIREYAAASRQDLPAVREKLLGLLTNINGKMLPQPAISAVFEAANVSRAYTTLASALNDALEDPDSDLAQINEATGTTVFDPSLVRKDTGSLGLARENEIGGTARTKPVFEMRAEDELFSSMLKLSTDFAPIRKVIDQLTAASQRGRFMNGIMARSIEAQMSQRPLPGIHEILDGILANPSSVQVSSSTMRFMHQLRAATPDLPVEFVPANQQMMDDFGKTDRSPGGRFLGSGMLQISVALDSNGLPIWTTGRMQTLLHEMVHAATVYELDRTQDSALIREVTLLRNEIISKARAKLGEQTVDNVLAFYRHESAAEPEGLKEYGAYLYGLTNNFELLAEGFTSPHFQQFLRTLDQTPTKSWYRNTWNALVRAASRLLGFKNPADNRILNDLMVLGLRTIAAQRGRAQRIKAARDKAVVEIQAILKIPAEQVAERVDRIFRGDMTEFESLRLPIGSVFSTRAQMPRGSFTSHGVESSDRMAFRAFTMGPQALGERIRKQREHNAFEAPPHLKNHEQIANITTPRLANAAAGLHRLMTSKFVAGARDRALGFLTTDFLVSRGARLFGNELDPTNPLIAWKRLRDVRRSHANRLLELAEKTVNSKWTKMNPHRSEQVGTMLQQTTLWQIDPEQGTSQVKYLVNTSQRAWTNKVNELNAAWAKLDADQKDLYRSVQEYFKQEYSQIRRAGIDLAIDLFGGQITDQQRTMLYTLRNADGVDQLIGTGLFIDLGDQNDKFKKVVRDLIRVSAIKGPYFPLMRKGNLVVEAAREGVLNDESGRPRNFDNKAEAQVQVDAIRARAPKNTARIVPEGDKFQVKYKMRHVSFHELQKDAEDAQAQLRKDGFEPGLITRKLESVEAASLTEGLKELMSKAESVTGGSSGSAAEQQLILQTLQSAFVQILAERAASASQQLKRQGVEGFKGKEAHEIFARRTKASSWHYANLKTALAQSKALSRLRTFTRDPSQGTAPSNIDQQTLALSRGRALNEITKRLRVEAEELDSLDKTNMDFYLGQLGFINFLATPSYAMVNAMQNFNVAMPYLTGKYGLRGAKALLRGMKVITGPTFAKAMRGLMSKPGEVTVYDVYSAIGEAVAEHPRYAQFAKAQGSKPSALQELVNMGVINASFVQELASVANNQNLTVSRGMEWLRLFPQGAELWNRISTALAVLEVTNGDVEAAADAVWKTHFGYDIENRPRYFRKIGGTRLPQAITMFKIYGVSMYQLTGSLIVDTVSKRGQSMQDRRRAATALSGIIAAHVLSAGVIGGVMLEPLRLLMQLWHAMFGDDDEFFDLDTSVQLWAKEVTESDLGGRLLSRGLWNALGFDLSGRMGLDRILMYDPPESFTQSELWKTFGALLGPIPSMIVLKSTRAYELATVHGKPFEAIMEIIPVRMLQDARKAWRLITEGVTTPAGDVITGPENFSWLQAVGRAAGLQTTEEAKLSDQAATAFGYRNWRTARVRQLSAAFWHAQDAGDTKAIAQAVADIELFNQKNPGAPVTAQSLRQSRQSSQRSIRDRTGESRNPDLNKLLDY